MLDSVAGLLCAGLSRDGVQINARADNWLEISHLPAPLSNSAVTGMLTVPCHWEDEMARERTGQPPSYTEAKKMKSLTLHTNDCPRQA